MKEAIYWSHGDAPDPQHRTWVTPAPVDGGAWTGRDADRARPRRWIRVEWRRGWIAALLFCLPALVYWPTVFHRYGFRDDYSILREAHDAPMKVVRVSAAQARPLDGVLLAASFRRVPNITGLQWLRLGGALLVGVLVAALYGQLRRLKWDRGTAALLAALVAVLPGTQLLVSWAVSWPLAVALLLAWAGFLCAERAFGRVAMMGAGHASRRRRRRRHGREVAPRPAGVRVGWWAAAVGLVFASALIYPTDTLFYFTAVAAALWSRRRCTARHGLPWLFRHAATVAVGLAAAFATTMVAFAAGWAPVSRRIALEHDWLDKAAWFVREPLQDALALIVLNEDGGSRAVHRFGLLVGLAIVAGVACCGFARRWRNGPWWSLALVALIPASFLVNLVVADRWPAYRVLLPMTATIAVALAVALLALGGRWLARTVLLLLVVPGIWFARRQTFQLIAWPQSLELGLMAAGAVQIDPAAHARVFIVRPALGDHPAARVFGDEFGSLSTNSDWAPKEMLKLLMRHRHPDIPDITQRYTVKTGRTPPADHSYDLLIDLRLLRSFRPGAH